MKCKDTTVLFVFVILATIFSIFNVGYEPVHSDEVIYLSLMKYHDDPTLYSKDFLISKILPGIPIQFYTVMGYVSKFIDKDLLFFFVYILTRALLILSIYFLAYTIFKDKTVAYLSVISLILIRGFLVLGSYDILDKIVFPFFLAVPFLLFSIALFLRKDYIASTLLLVIATYLHATTSFFVLLLYAFYFVTNYKKINKNALFSAVIFIALAFPIFLKSASATQINYLALEEWLNFLRLRVSGHFFPFSWPVRDFLLFSVLIAMFLISFKHKSEKEKHRKIMAIFLGGFILFLIGIIFTEFFPVKQVIQASLFRGIVIIRVLAFIYIINHIVRAFKEKTANKVLATTMAIFLIISATMPFFTGAQKGVFSEVSIEKEIGLWEDISIKARELTPKDSLFITPTFNLGFTFFSERSEFINWKTSGVAVYSTDYVAEAIKRFELVCTHPLNFKSRAELVEVCKKGYSSINEQNLKSAKEKYKVTHIIIEKPKSLNLKKIYENEVYTIYEL